MNLLFLTLLDFGSINERNLYTDLLREFKKNGHNLYIISPVERKRKITTYCKYEDNVTILKLKIGNMQKTNIVEKGISTLSIEPLFKLAIKKYFSDVKFDLVLYSTPPITFCGAINYVKKRDKAMTYLLLKDIFPQNSLDLGMLSKNGIKGLLYRWFRNKEKNLYEISDKIGCMSKANVDFLLQHNKKIADSKVEVCPNSVELLDMSATAEERILLRNKYQLPLNRKIFVYGGNLGKPQGVDFLIECLKKSANNPEFYLIVGDGTEYYKLEEFVKKENPSNVSLIRSLPKCDYDKMIGCCDVGMIFLDYRFTIPNYPSRFLAYLQAGIPVLSVTDRATDIGKFIEDNQVGTCCYSDNIEQFLDKVCFMREQCYEKKHIQDVLEKNFNVVDSYRTIMRSLNENCSK